MFHWKHKTAMLLAISVLTALSAIAGYADRLGDGLHW